MAKINSVFSTTTDEAYFWPIASRAQVSYLPTVEAHNMQIAIFRSFLITFVNRLAGTFIYSRLHFSCLLSVPLHWVHCLPLGLSRNSSPPSSLSSTSPRSWPIESVEICLVWRWHRRRLVRIESVGRRRGLVVELLRRRRRRRELLELVPTSPTPPLPITSGRGLGPLPLPRPAIAPFTT